MKTKRKTTIKPSDLKQLKTRALKQPSAGRLAPIIDRFTQRMTQEYGALDPISPQKYYDFLTTCPPAKAATKVVILLALSYLGDYQHSDEKVTKFIHLNFEQMRGDFRSCVGQMLGVLLGLGWSCNEIAVQAIEDFWVLESLALVDPRRYQFRGSKGEIDDIRYRSSSTIGGDIDIPYEKILHLTNNKDLNWWDDPYGVSDLRSAIAAGEAWQATMGELMLAINKKATARTVGYYDGELGSVPIFDDNGQPVLNSDGSQATKSPGQDMVDTLADCDTRSAFVTAVGNKIETLDESGEMTIFFDALGFFHKLVYLSLLVPETIFEVVGGGTGDSNLNEGHSATLDAWIQSLMDNVKNGLIEEVVRPLIVWNFGAQENYGEFVVPDAEEGDRTEALRIFMEYMDKFGSTEDLESVNRLRSLAGLSTVEKIEDALMDVPLDADQELNDLLGDDDDEQSGDDTPDDDSNDDDRGRNDDADSDSDSVDSFSFSLAFAQATTVEDYLTAIINVTYTDRVDALLSWGLDGETFTGQFRDDPKIYDFTISESGIDYKLSNPDDIDGDEPSNFAATKKARNCPRGTPCGGSCISKNKTCRKSMSPAQLKAHKKALRQARKQKQQEGKTASPTSREQLIAALNEDPEFVKGNDIKGSLRELTVDPEQLKKTLTLEMEDYPTDGMKRHRLKSRKHPLTKTTNEVRISYAANDGVADFNTQWEISATAPIFRKEAAERVELNRKAVESLEKLNWNGKLYDIGVLIDGNYSDSDGLSDKQKIRRAIKTKRAWDNILQGIPEGTVLSNSPVGGSQGKRAAFYKKNGFGDKGKTGQYGFVVVENGKKVVKPVNIDAETSSRRARRGASGGSQRLNTAEARSRRDRRVSQQSDRAEAIERLLDNLLNDN